MASNSDSNVSFGSSVLSIFWLANIIYTIIYWGGWAIFWNIFIPYALLWDLVTKFGHQIHH